MLPLSRHDNGDMYFSDQLIASGSNYANDTEWMLVIRPERLFILNDTTTASENTAIFNGQIREFVYQGDTAFIVMSISDEHTLAFRFGTNASPDDSIGTANLQPGQNIRVGLKRDNIIVIPREHTV